MPNVKYKELAKAAEKVSGSTSSEEISNYFLKVGTELKGQNQSCYRAFGWKLAAQASVDPLKLHTAGVFSSELSLDIHGTALTKLLIAIQIGPEKVGDITVQAPIMLNFYTGSTYKGGMKCAMFVGLSHAAGNEETVANASVNLGAHASGTLNGEYFYGYNIQPLVFDKDSEGHSTLRKTLDELFKADNYKAFLKMPAVEFINAKSSSVGNGKLKLQKTSLWGYLNGSNIETSTLVEELKTIESCKSQFPPVRAKARTLRKNLEYYKENKGPSIVTSVRVFCGEAGVAGKLTADISLNANLKGVNANFNSKNTFLDTTASYRSAYVRCQTAYPATKTEMEGKGFIVMTQDTNLRYAGYDFIAASTDTSINEKSLIKEETKTFSEHRMNYVTTTIYWYSEVEKKVNRFKNKIKDPDEEKSKSLLGSGISYGGSFCLERLKYSIDFNHSIEYFENDKDLTEEIFVKRIKSALEDYKLEFDERKEKLWIDYTSLPKAYTVLLAMTADDKDKSKLKNALEWLLKKENVDLDSNLIKKFQTDFKDRLIKDDFLHGTAGVSFETKNSLVNILSKCYANFNLETQAEQFKKFTARNLANNNKLREYLVDSKSEFECDKKIQEFLSPKRDYLNFVADTLNVSLGQLYDFFTDSPFVSELILNHDSFEHIKTLDAIILESGFFMENEEITIVKTTVCKEKIRTFQLSSSDDQNNYQQLIELEGKTAHNLITTFNGYDKKKKHEKLSVIRMRYRIQDTKNKEKKLFSLGAKIAGNGAKFKLSKIDEAGSEGIIDLYTKWYPGNKTIVSSSESVQYNKGVPAVALFSQ
jgi:hypothetical protein